MVSEKISILVWDLPTRVFHWLLVLLMAALWWSADAGEMQWHQIFAYSLMILVVFRILWGFVGSQTSRFADFIHRPRVAAAFFNHLRRGVVPHHVGHNPLGGYMVLLMMLLITMQLITGLFATDDIFTEGPFYSYVDSELASGLTWLHKKNFDVILLLTAIHVLAVIAHSIKGEKLIPAMIHGKKHLPLSAQKLPAEPLRFKSVLLAVSIFLLVGAVVTHYFMWPVIQAL